MRKFFWKRLAIGAEGSKALSVEPGSYVVMRCLSFSNSIAQSVVQTTMVSVMGPFVDAEQEKEFLEKAFIDDVFEEIEFKNDGSWTEEIVSSTDAKS